jgi:CheY-like chemotaxis protein
VIRVTAHCFEGVYAICVMAKLLIVECDDHTNGRFQEIFAARGFDTFGTWSGHEALRLLESAEFNIVLVDNYLPDLYVGDFLERLIRLRVLPIIVVMHQSLPTDWELGLFYFRRLANILHTCDPLSPLPGEVLVFRP